MFEWFQEGTNIGFGMILRPLKLATWLELLKDLEKKKKDGMVFTVLHFDFLVKWELVNFGVNKVESFNLLRIRHKINQELKTKLRNENWKRIQNILAVQCKVPNSSLSTSICYLKSEIERKM